MSVILDAQSCILNLKITYDIHAEPHMASVPPKISFDRFVCLRLSMNAMENGYRDAFLLLDVSDSCDLYATTVESGVIKLAESLHNTFESRRIHIPDNGFVDITYENYGKNIISRLYSPLNTKVIVTMEPIKSDYVGGYILLGKRNYLADPPFQKPTMLSSLTGCIPSGIHQIEARLDPGMNLFCKYQFSILLVLPNGERIYCNDYIELLPGGKTRRGKYNTVQEGE